MKVEMYQISETEWISECGEWEISTKTGSPKVYHLGEYVDMGKVDCPDEVEKLYGQLQEEEEEKGARIHIRIEESLKNEFYSKCEENFQTPSVVLRGLIKKFVEEEYN